MKKVILFRSNSYNKKEMEIASKYFDVVESRVGLDNSLVIGRYSTLPYYHELVRDLRNQSSVLINDLLEHQYISCFDYYESIKKYTPKTYFNLNEVTGNGPYVLKGRTNSRKEQWLEKMFVKGKEDLLLKYLDLSNDPLIQEQGVIIRDYIPLEKVSTSINGLNFANEWRFFCFKNKILSYGYYWSNGDIILKDIDIEGIKLVEKVMPIISKHTNFYVVDIAKTEEGNWIVVELNDGQQSGLSENDPEELYSNLKKSLK